MSWGRVVSGDLVCPNGHGEMVMLPNHHVYGCEQCGWGVSGFEVHTHVGRNLAAMIADKAIGKQYGADGCFDPEHL
jgi:hypothetical protein